MIQFKHNSNSFLATLVLGLFLTCASNVWGDTFTVNSSTTSSDALFGVSEAMTNYTYSGYWAADAKLIEMATSASITVTNVTGATITAISVEGVADNNSNKTVNFTGSDGTTSAATSSGSWNNRKSASLTSKALNSTNVNKFKCDAGQTYTLTNNASSSYKAGVRFVITYTSTLPTSLVNGATTSSTQALSWTAPSTAPANGYLVAYSSSTSTVPANSVTSTTGSYTVVAVEAGTTNMTLSELSGSTTYNWWVRSKNARGNSSWVAGSSFTTESAAPIPTTKTIYLKPGVWKTGESNERFAVYCWNSGGEEWYDMSLFVQNDCDGTVYKAEVDPQYETYIFCRMNNGDAENKWDNRWNQTENMTAADGEYGEITGWGSGNSPCNWGHKPYDVCVSGTWLAFAGETITLTATCACATHFQWYKNSVAIDGATSATYTKTNCTHEDGGSYYCMAWGAAGESEAKGSNVYGVRVPYLAIQTGGGGDRQDLDFTRTSTSDETATCEIYLGVAWDYEMKVIDGVDEHGNTGTMTSTNCTGWTMDKDESTWCRIHTTKEGTYHFTLSFSNSVYTPVKLSAIYPPMKQRGDVKIYIENTLDMQGRGWNNDKIYYRIGKGKYSDGDDKNWTTAQLMDLVPGTARYLYTTTPDWSDNFWVWHIANNAGWAASNNSIYKTNTGDSWAITESSNFHGDEVTTDRTIILNSTPGAPSTDPMNNNCQFYGYESTPGMIVHNASVGSTTNGQIKVEYTHHDNTAQTNEAYASRTINDLAHTCNLKITGVPDDGYKVVSMTVNGEAFTSGNTHILAADATITATFDHATYPITYYLNDGTINDVGYATEYTHGTGATLPTDVTKDGYDFKGWYSDGSFSGEAVTVIGTTEWGDKEFYAKWELSKPKPVFTWTYDATVKAGGIYPMSVSSTGDADVTLTLVAAVTGVTPTFTAGNPATGSVAIGAYPTQTSFTYQATSPATASYKELTETRTVTITRCETEYNVAYGVGYTNAGGSATPRYYHETEGVGRITKGSGGSSNEGTAATWSGESWITKSNKNSSHLLQTYKDNIVKLVYYVMAGATNVTISHLRLSDTYISSDSEGDDGLSGATIVYNNTPSQAGLTKNAQEVAAVVLAEPLDADDYVYTVFSSSSTLYGVKLIRAEGDEETSLAFSDATTIEKYPSDAPFTRIATQTTTPIKSGGKITYSSSDETVATVNKNTGEVTILREGNTLIMATLSEYGCFKKSTATYTLRVVPCTDPECTIAVTSGRATKCVGASVTMTATAVAGATFQWYKDGVEMLGETNATLTTNEPGDYYAKATKVCAQQSNTISVTNLGDPTATRLHEYYYVKAGRETPDIALFQLTNATGFTMSPVAAPEGCSYELREDGIVYLTGIPATTLATEDYDITVTASNDCGSTTATATMHLYSLESTMHAKIAWIADGTKGQTLPGTVDASKSTNHALYKYLENYFDLTPVNAYCTIDESKIKDYYSQFDLVLLTDYPDTNIKPDGESGGKEKSYSNAIGCLIDEKPLLSFEAFVADCPNWGINKNPETPNPKQQEITLLCAAHDIFNGTFPTDEKITILSEIGGNGLQGFSAENAPSGMIFIATIEDPDNSRTLINCCERQQVIEARMMIMGLNYGAMSKVNADGKLIIKQIIEYLLNPKTMADCALVFDDAHNTHVWSDPQNWAPAHNTLPKPFQAVRIDKDCQVDVTDAHCSSIRLQKGIKNAETYDAHLTILPTGGLTVTDFIKKVQGTNFMTTYPISSEDLVIQSNATGNGSLVFGNESEDLQATVEYFSIAKDAKTGNPVWQYMGIPITDRPQAIDQYYAAWMCSWESVGNVSSNWRWVENEDRIVPFKGYCITHTENTKKYTHIGTLNAPTQIDLALHYFTSIDGDGFNMFANSWVAPIDITKMSTSDFNSAAEATIFIYNTGTYAQAIGAGDPSTTGTNTGAGQYNAIPVNAAPYLSGSLTKIPTMQGFFVRATKDGTLTLDYNRLCFNTTDFTTTSEIMRSPRRAKQNISPEEKIVPKVMRLDVASAQWSDRVYLLVHPEFSSAFERGWDGSKQEGAIEAPMLAAVDECGLLSVAAVNELDGRYLSFRAGEDTEYTFAFDYEGEPLYLYDLFTQQATEIKTGNTYSFEATDRTPSQRFLITATPPRMPTGVETVETEKVYQPKKFVRDGQLLILHRGAVYDALGTRIECRKEGAQ